MKIIIQYINPIYCKLITTNKINILNEFLFYLSRDKDRTYKNYLISKRDNKFLTGFLPTISNYCEQNNIELIINDHPLRENILIKEVYGITLRKYQKQAVRIALKKQRGLIVAPTGSGKTIIAMSIINSLPEHNILYLVHTKTLLYQTYQKFSQIFNKKDLGIIGDGKINPSRITIAMRQSLANIPLSTYHQMIDCVIQDEVHVAQKKKGQIYQIMTSIPASIRLGLTATPPQKSEDKMIAEGLFGPIIYTISPNILIEGKMLAKPKIKFISVPHTEELRYIYQYKEAYDIGIVTNKKRNQAICEKVIEIIKENKTALILINRIEHGNILLQMLNKYINIEFIYGETSSEIRNILKLQLEKKRLQAAISMSQVWGIGVDFPSLDCVCLAGGLGKTDIQILQAIGRGMRIKGEKQEVIILDCLDLDNYYLTNHLGYRLSLYSKLGWI